MLKDLSPFSLSQKGAVFVLSCFHSQTTAHSKKMHISTIAGVHEHTHRHMWWPDPMQFESGTKTNSERDEGNQFPFETQT